RRGIARRRLRQPVSAELVLSRFPGLALAGCPARTCCLCERRALQPALRGYCGLGLDPGLGDRPYESGRVKPGLWAECTGGRALGATEDRLHLSRHRNRRTRRLVREISGRVAIWHRKRERRRLCRGQRLAGGWLARRAVLSVAELLWGPRLARREGRGPYKCYC